ncbi:hypothetical protein FG386_003450 [Cryptosporidium ryanae]|uniref:uncharacterized protein n=1 Tax=Cryptosporidium ryanae TaxID=515981 RepID=UPI00351AAC79|nr:hypothetical protein FG386_003450 [Cryptosporidium ryanae]
MFSFILIFASFVVALNYVLLRFPRMLMFINGSNSKLKRENRVLGRGRGCLHISHRGGSNEYPENTIIAFENSINKCNTDMLETDVWLTKDNVLVVLHDENLSCICGINKCVGEYNYNELPLIKDSSSLKPSSDYLDKSVWSCFKNKFGPQKIPTLEELFQRYPNVLISVDIKNPDCICAVEKTVQLVRKYNRESKTMLCSFSDRNIEYIKKISSNLENELIICVGEKKLFLILISYFLGLLPWLNIDEHVFSFPYSHIFFSNYSKALSRKISSNKYIKVNQEHINSALKNLMSWLFTRKPLIKHLQKRGIRCFAWVCNNTDEFKVCSELGLDGIMTDEPSLLREYYNKLNIKPFKYT